MSKPNVVFVLGGPGAGKGTQCENIVKNFGFVHLSAGDLLREERNKSGSKFGDLIDQHIRDGTIVPVDITRSLLERAMEESGSNSFLIDGFPRNQDNLDGWQRQMSEKVNIPFVLLFDCDEDICVQRCLQRGNAGSGRSDDNIESLKKRVLTYNNDTLPVLKRFSEMNLVKRIDAAKPAADVFEESLYYTMLYLIGLGLGDPSDITVKGLEIVKKCMYVYLEAYTSILCDNKDELGEFFKKEIIVADRELVEQGADEILNRARTEDVAFLVVGDPFGATTHTDIVLRAKEMGINVDVVHNASIMNAIGVCGLQLYSFGETVSIPFWTESWKPDSFFEKICNNKKRGLHTLCLLDIKVKEPNLESMVKGKIKYDPPRFMTVAQAASQLIQIINNLPQDSEWTGIFNVADECVGVARVGSKNQKIVACSLTEMETMDLGSPLHSLVICGKMHPLENDYLSMYKVQISK